MSDENVLQLITTEFKDQTFGVTTQYLEIHAPIYNNGSLVVERIDREQTDGSVIAYLPVENELFYFAVYIDPSTKEILSIGTESRNKVCLQASSDELTLQQLRSFINLSPTTFWDKGDATPDGRSTRKFSYLEFEPNPEPDQLEDKLKKLLAYLESDAENVAELTQKTHASIGITMDLHNGNQLLGGATLDLESIAKLNRLNLSLSFDINAWGNPFK